MAKKRSRNAIKIPRLKADDQPATRRMLKLVRGELKEAIRLSVLELKDEFNSKFIGLEARMSKVENKMSSLENKLDTSFSALSKQIYRTNLLVEEQNANNRIVLEGLQALWQRQERLELSSDSSR